MQGLYKRRRLPPSTGEHLFWAVAAVESAVLQKAPALGPLRRSDLRWLPGLAGLSSRRVLTVARRLGAVKGGLPTKRLGFDVDSVRRVQVAGRAPRHPRFAVLPEDLLGGAAEDDHPVVEVVVQEEVAAGQLERQG